MYCGGRGSHRASRCPSKFADAGSGSSKRHSSSHSSSDDSSANEVITPEEEFEVEEDAKDAYSEALCGSLRPLNIPIPKRPEQDPSADSPIFCQARSSRDRPFSWNSFTVERIGGGAPSISSRLPASWRLDAA
ncbi:hypothetical protein Bca52824_035600 [Brassica carinata]|uniref:Uncharacterized protein n=1 Tax=Brassica carinata TaxID=52824 RepID=A0A8X7S3I6_BRACI|nr:hypothetical protein Bca52824_035600 [Brassica carinata]